MGHSGSRHVFLVSIELGFVMDKAQNLDLIFFRFKLLIESEAGESDSESVIRQNAVERGVLALPGTVFLPNGRKTPYVRASFSLLPPEDVEEALKRLRGAILEVRHDRQ